MKATEKYYLVLYTVYIMKESKWFFNHFDLKLKVKTFESVDAIQ